MIKDEIQAVIGVDVGFYGATVLMRLDREVLDIHFNYEGAKEYSEVIEGWIEDFKIINVLIENQHAWPQQGLVSTFTLGQNFGELIGVYSALKLPISFVDPKAWQKEMCQGTGDFSKNDVRNDPKKRALAAVKFLFPEITLRRTEKCKVQHDGAVDALLIAEFARRAYLAQKFHEEDKWIEELPDNKADLDFLGLDGVNSDS